MTEREALKLALEALEKSHTCPLLPDDCAEAITAIKEALANVATNDTSQERVDKTSESVHEPWSPVSIGVDVTKKGAHVVGIYALDKDTSQVFYAKYYPVPQRKPLTDEEIINEADRFDWGKDCAVRFARAIEAAHGIKGEG